VTNYEAVREAMGEAQVIVLWRGRKKDHPEMVLRGWRDCTWSEYLDRIDQVVMTYPGRCMVETYTITQVETFCILNGLDINDRHDRLEAVTMMALRDNT
jgi:hypothetical protein